MLTVYFGTPSMFITLWFGFDYGTNPPLGTPRQEGERPYYRSKVDAHPRHEAEGLQGGVARA
jgi:hypothetical protein